MLEDIEFYKSRNREIVKQQADNIRQKISKGLLYGVPVDMDDIDALILSAYLLGCSETRKERQRFVIK